MSVGEYFNPRDNPAIGPQMGFSNHFSFFIGIVLQKLYNPPKYNRRHLQALYVKERVDSGE